MAKKFIPRVPKFTGELDEPILDPKFSFAVLSGRPIHASELQAAKMPLLLRFFGIDESDPSAWLKLSFRLACIIVPGFQVVRSRPRVGRPRRWQSGDYWRLIDAVESVKPKVRGHTIDALKWLIKHDEAWKGRRLRSLKTRYHEANKVIARARAIFGDSIIQIP